MYKYKNEHNHQHADDWLWDTIPNTTHSLPLPFSSLLGILHAPYFGMSEALPR